MMVTESEYIEMDLKEMTSEKLRLLSVLNHEEQSQEDIAGKSGLSIPYTCYMLDQFQVCVIANRHHRLTGYGTHLKASAFPEMDEKAEP